MKKSRIKDVTHILTFSLIQARCDVIYGRTLFTSLYLTLMREPIRFPLPFLPFESRKTGTPKRNPENGDPDRNRPIQLEQKNGIIDDVINKNFEPEWKD